jgi:4a-hydroxytetrahydrobiopterin dehydratase
MMEGLSEEEITARLGQLPAWQVFDNTLQRQWKFPSFFEGIRFINRVAELADAADHHPDIDIRYTRITIRLWTHTANGITEKDFDLAKQIDRAAPAR